MLDTAMIRRRLGEFDPIEKLSASYPRLLLQAGFGVLCFGAAYATREFIDMFSVGAGPFSLIFPTIMISTLYGRWQSGLVTFCLAFLHAWYFVLPFPQSFAFENAEDGARTIVNGSAALLILYLAEVFRAAVRRSSSERDQELETQHLLMRELEHRTKNNFAMVSSLLSMQQRDSASEEVKHALMSAAARVQSFAAIHETIYTSAKYSAEVSLAQYLEPLIRQLERGLFDGRPVTVALKCDPVSVPRDRALAFGLIVNELVTNAAKHAFPEGREGQVTVEYRAEENAPWCLSVSDDGCGNINADSADDGAGSGLGKTLLASFAITAGGEITVENLETGTRIKIVEIRNAWDVA